MGFNYFIHEYFNYLRHYYFNYFRHDYFSGFKCEAQLVDPDLFFNKLFIKYPKINFYAYLLFDPEFFNLEF